MAEKRIRIQIFPRFGESYQVLLPASVQNNEDILNWIDDNLKSIESWAWKRLKD